MIGKLRDLQHPDGDEEREEQLVLFEETSTHVGIHVVRKEVVELLQPLLQVVALFALTDTLKYRRTRRRSMDSFGERVG